MRRCSTRQNTNLCQWMCVSMRKVTLLMLLPCYRVPLLYRSTPGPKKLVGLRFELKSLST
jgi:hypothetical protein